MRRLLLTAFILIVSACAAAPPGKPVSFAAVPKCKIATDGTFNPGQDGCSPDGLQLPGIVNIPPPIMVQP